MGGEDEPPPKGAYWLLSRAVPESGTDLTPDEVPRVVGQAFLYGKQTDREARVELTAYRTQLADAQQAIADIVGDGLGAAGQEQISTQVPALQHALTTNWRLPEGTPPEKRQQLIRDQRREILLNSWPEMPRKIFGDKSASEVAGDSDQRIKLLAAILLLEVATDQVASEFDFNELRRKLGCPEAEPIDPTQTSPADLPLARFSRVDVKKLSDEQLVELYQRADHYRHIAALRKLAQEAIARPALDKLDRAEVYGLLAQIEPEGAAAVAYSGQGARGGRGGQEIDRPVGPGRAGPAHFAWRSGRRGSAVAPHSRAAHARAGRGAGPVSDSGRGRHHRTRRTAAHAGGRRAERNAGHRRARRRRRAG